MLNVCVIGCGRAGMIHARSYAGRVIGARLAALCDPVAEAREAAGAELGVSRLYANWQDVMADPDIDAVVVVTPTRFHHDVVLAAAAAGKHVFCEKPMASSEAECDEMIAACEKAGVKLQIGFMRRFDESYVHAKERIDAGDIGEVVLVRSTTRGPSHPKPWMYDIWSNYGPIGEVSSHDFDLLRWFTGSEVESIFTVGGNYRSPEVKEEYPDFYDTFTASLTFENGMLGGIDGAQYVQYGYDSRMEVLGTHGSVMVGQQPKETYVVATADGRVTRPMNHSWTYLYREAYVAEAQAFVDAIARNETPRVTGHDGKMAVRLVNAGLASLLEKRVVTL